MRLMQDVDMADSLSIGHRDIFCWADNSAAAFRRGWGGCREIVVGRAVFRRQCLLIFVDLPFKDGFTDTSIIHRDCYLCL